MPLPLTNAKHTQPLRKSTSAATSQAQRDPLSSVPSGLTQRATSAPSRLPGNDLLYLQRTIGNQAVAQMLGRSGDRQGLSTSPIIQPKLKVVPSNDRYEQEVDNVAKQVTQTHSPVAQRAPDTSIPVVGAKGGALDSSITSAIHHEQL